MKVLKFLNRHLEEMIMGIFLTIIIAAMVLQIFFRYVLNDSLSWSEELCRYCYIWLMFLAFSFSVSQKSDLRVDVFLNMLPATARRVADLVGLIICLAITGFLFYHSFETVSAVMQTGETSVSIHLPMQYVYVASVVGYGLGTFRYIQRIIQLLAPAKTNDTEGDAA